MSTECCPARGGDEELRLQCIREPHDDNWHLDGPERWWKTVPDEQKEAS
ncbi:hypothetical protein [Kitasatospora kifunensis]|uniref:Uncharacterized protein n=1 Tax=Kitasatospora kifunensis TaxID=58351 RepID=A0A7W7QYR4_KITKI|nr:hypothetical protein [Kitasatospora kifunensis]MBB4922179.1 hypothetical protein [Kitasatospora kifunensis]